MARQWKKEGMKGREGREETGIKDGEGGDMGPLCGKGVERGGEEGKQRRNGDVLHIRPSSYSLLCVRESNQMKFKHMTLIHL